VLKLRKERLANYDLASLAPSIRKKRMHERNNELEGPSKLAVDGVFYQEAQEIRKRTWRESNPQ
jgi:hypothetical protein